MFFDVVELRKLDFSIKRQILIDEMNLNESDNFTEVPILERCGWSLDERVYKSPIRYLDWVTYPLLLGLATVGNILNVLVLMKELPRTSKNVYLISLAFTDFIYMWSGFFPYLNELIKHVPDFKTFYQSITGVCMFLQEAAALGSDWIVVAFTIERFLAIRSPLHHISISTISRSSYIIGLVNSLAMLASMDRLVDYYWFFVNDSGIGPLPIRPEGVRRWREIYGYFLVAIPLICFLVMIILNGTLIRVIIRKRRTRQVELLASQDVGSSSKIDKTAYKMLAACVLLYLFTQFPAFVANILEALDLLCVRQMTRMTRAQLNPVKYFFLNVNYSINFLLYCAISSTFRASVKRCSTRTRDISATYQLSSASNSANSKVESNLRQRSDSTRVHLQNHIQITAM